MCLMSVFTAECASETILQNDWYLVQLRQNIRLIFGQMCSDVGPVWGRLSRSVVVFIGLHFTKWTHVYV